MWLANSESVSWAREDLGGVDLGDERRKDRLTLMAARAAEKPSGKVSEVFASDAERQGAYDFLENRHVDPKAILLAAGRSTARRAAQNEFAYVAIDGTSLSLTDRARRKDFGSVGDLAHKGRGLKVINAMALSPKGVPLGLCAQSWWARTSAVTQSRKDKAKRNIARDVKDKETQRWLDTIDATCARFNEAGAKAWFLLDREADCLDILLLLAAASNHRFTVRASWDRLLESTGKNKQYLRGTLAKKKVIGRYLVDVPASPTRAARSARMVMRAAKVTLKLRCKRTKKTTPLEVTAVWVREQRSSSRGENPLDWLLLTNHIVETAEDVRLVVFGYTQRWRVEDFHRTWKSGACNVEDMQIRSKKAATTWAIILAVVAIRIERIKHLARQTPDVPANVELNPREIRALLLLKRRQKKRTEVIPNTMPTIGHATRWLAELGGYTGKSSGGPPGAITIGRGLERVRTAAQLLAALEAEQNETNG
jgi:hypothetical protein